MSPIAPDADHIRGLFRADPHDARALDPPRVVYVLERARSRSNATQTVDFLVIAPDSGRPVSIGRELAALCGLSYDQPRQGVIVREPLTVARLLEQFSAKVFGQPRAIAVEWL